MGWSLLGTAWLAGALGTSVVALLLRGERFEKERGAILRITLVAATVILLAGAMTSGVITGPPSQTIVIATGVLAALVASVGGVPVVGLAMRLVGLALAAGGDRVAESAKQALQEVEQRRAQEAPAHTAAVIGVLERFAFVIALLIGLPEVAAVVFAVKALGWFTAGQAPTKVVASRIVGTLASLVWALLVFVAFQTISR